jgi:CBS domain containing-hemolysin-like protein
MSDPYQLTVIFICLLFSAFFSGIEIAFISADKLHIELLNQKGAISGKVLSYFQKFRGRFIATTLVGNNLALVIYGIFMAKLVEPLLSEHLPVWMNDEGVILVLQTLIATLVVLITAEFLPKSLFLINPDFFLSVLSVPMLVIYILLFPVVSLVKGIMTIMRIKDPPAAPVYGLSDLNNYIRKNVLNSEEEDAEIDAKSFNKAIE